MTILFTIYSKDNCQYCVKAMDVISDIVGHDVTRINVIKNPDANTVAKLKADTGHTTYPFIFLGDNETFIGGYYDLATNFAYVGGKLKLLFGFDPDQEF